MMRKEKDGKPDLRAQSEKLAAEGLSVSVTRKTENRRRTLTSLQTSMVPKMTWRPSKKLSPMMMTVAPPVVQPSLGLMALMQGGDPGWRTQGEHHSINLSTQL